MLTEIIILSCRKYNLDMKRVFLFFVFLLSACAHPTASQTPLSSITLLPYHTPPPGPTSGVPDSLEGFIETPLPSPTPFIYEIQPGDTMSGIAEKFGVSLDELLALNPDVSPNSMPIGAKLTVPMQRTSLSSALTLTPVPVPIEQITCHPTADSGAWCFVLVHNEFEETIENLSAQVTLLGVDGQTISTALALSPLNILPSGASLPLAVFFSPTLPPEIHPQAQLLTGIRLLPEDARYLPASVYNTLVQVDRSGRSAQVSGIVRLPENSPAASLVWVAAVAYDQAGQIVGMRRWESSAKLPPGGSLPFTFSVSSAAGEIERVEFVLEVRP